MSYFTLKTRVIIVIIEDYFFIAEIQMIKNKEILFSSEHTVRWQDMDSFNHVNHTLYLVYLQECRINWLRHHGIDMSSSDSVPIISEANCKYKRPITYPAQITVELYFTQRIGKRIFFEQLIRDSNDQNVIYATANIVVVWINLASGRSIIPPPEYDFVLSTPWHTQSDSSS